MFQSIVENAPIGVLVVDSFNEVTYCNLMALSILPINEQTIVGSKLLEIIPGISILENLKAGNRSYTGDAEIISISSADGSEGYFEVQSSRPADAHDSIKHIVTLTDVTRRVRALQAVEGQEHRWDLALQGSQIGVFESDLRTGTGFASQTWFELLGISKAKGRDSDAEWQARVHPDDLTLVVSSDAKCIEGLSEKSETCFRMKVQDGTWHWMRSIIRVTERDGAGKSVRLLGTMVDITEQKRVDEL